MKILLLAAASLLAVSAPVLASSVSVATDPNAPTGNFGAPGNTATAGYDIVLGDDGKSFTASLVQTGGTSTGAFANLYFDLNPSVKDGSDLGFTLGGSGVTAFIPGKNGQPGFETAIDPALYTFAATTVSGLTTINLSLANSLFLSAIPGLAYYPGQTFEGVAVLRLSQSLSYSVAGGESYGENRLGSVAIPAAVPEPATWAMMLFGIGAVGVTARRRRAAPALAA